MLESGPLLFDDMGMDERFGALRRIVTVCLLQAGCVRELPDPAAYVLDGTGEPGLSAGTTSGGPTSGLNDSATSEAGATLAVAAEETLADFDSVGASTMDETATPAESNTGAESEPDCTDADDACSPPDPPVLLLETRLMKQFAFAWEPQEDVEYYNLEERRPPEDDFMLLVEDIRESSLVMTVPLHLSHRVSYRLQACNAAGCTSSDPVAPDDALVGAIGYFKPSDTAYQHFGFSLAMSDDGRTLAVGAPGQHEREAQGDQPARPQVAGAVYVYTLGDDGTWGEHVLQPDDVDEPLPDFGTTLALSGDGRLLVVAVVPRFNLEGERDEIGRIYTFVRDANGEWTPDNEEWILAMAEEQPAEDTAGASLALSADGSTLAVGFSQSGGGVVSVYERDGGGWTRQQELQSTNIEAEDGFGRAVALSAEGDVLAVGAPGEDGDAASSEFGAVYIFERDDAGAWNQRHYLSARNAEPQARFGTSLSFGGNDMLLAIGAPGVENQRDRQLSVPGAAYIFERMSAEPGAAWEERARVLAEIEASHDWFGRSVALDGRGELLFVGVRADSRNGAGVFGHPNEVDPEQDAAKVGAVYVYQRSASSQEWSITAYLKSSVPQADSRVEDEFGETIAISEDGNTVAVGVTRDDGTRVDLGHPPAFVPDPSRENDEAVSRTFSSGAVFLY